MDENWFRERGSGERLAYGYRSKACWIMARDFFVCACTARKVSVGTSSCRNAVI